MVKPTEGAGGAFFAAPTMPMPPKFATVAEERLHRKQILAGSLRLFSYYGFDEGAAGHITVRDPEDPETFWVNPFGVDFSQVNVSNLIHVDSKGKILQGKHPLNLAAFAIHSKVHSSRPDVVAAAHSHSTYGKTWSVFGKPLDPLTQDACAFYEDHGVYTDYGGVALELDEGDRIAKALGNHKAVILQNHGLLTVGKESLEECVWWYISMERCCKVQLLAQAAASQGLKQHHISHESAKQANQIIGNSYSGWAQFMMVYERIKKLQPDFLQ